MKASAWTRLSGLIVLILSVTLLSAVWTLGITTEVPIGGIRGTVTMSPSNAALPNAEVILYADFETPEDSQDSWVTRTDEKGEFRLRSLPAGLYNVEVYGKAHRSKDKLVALVKEGETEEMHIATERSDNDLDLHVNQRVFVPEEKPDITLSGYTDAKSVHFQLFKVPYASLFDKRTPDNLVRSLTTNRNAQDPAQTAGLQLGWEDTRDLTAKDVEGHFVEQVQLAPQAEGLYLVKASIGEEIKFAWISVTRIALVTKSQNGKVLSFVTDLQSGKPVVGATLSVMTGVALKSVGKSGQDGILKFDMGQDSSDTKVVVADSGASRAFTWFYGSSDGAQGKTVLWAQTDRPVYRPGDLIQYKIVARDTLASGYSVPQGTVDVTVSDPDETEIDHKQLVLSPDGTVSGSFQTDAQTLPGSYEIKIAHGESSDRYYVNVVSYRKPEFKVDVRAKRKSYIRGENAEFTVHAETYTGEPAPGMDLGGWIYRRDDWSYSPFDENSDEYDPDSYDSGYVGDALQEITGKTDSNGDCTISVPTAGLKTEDANLTDAEFTAEVSVADASGRTAEGRGHTRVVRGEFDLKVSPERYIVDPGEQVRVKVQANWNQDGTPVVGQSIDLEFGHERWSGRKSAYVIEGRQTVVLDQAGEAMVVLNPTEKGEFLVKLRSTDKRANTIQAESGVWVMTGGSAYEGPVPDIALILDKANYKPGDKAKVLIQTDHPGGTALVTVEADGVLWSKTVALASQATTLDIDKIDQFAPNAIVNVSYVREKEYYSATKNLKVDLVQKRVNVAVEPDRATVKPGEPVTYKLRVTDQQGRPVRANIALGMVDESVYAIAEDNNDPMSAFYPRRWSSVNTAYSFPMVYLDGEDKNPKAVRIRRDFRDTALWMPNVVTDAAGQASVTAVAPDNLTEWRATATAFTSDTRIGKSKAKVVAKLDLMARLSLPMFMVEGDSQRISARISNTTDRRMKVRAQIFATGTGLSGTADQSIDLGPGETKELSWSAQPTDMGDAKFKLVATETGGKASDGVEQSVPVKVHGRHMTTSAVGEASGEATASLDLDPGAVNGALKIQVTPTLLGTLVQALPGLIDYPYGCTEQTMSRFVPASMVVRLMRETGFHDPAESRLPGIVSDSLNRIRRLQSSSGGWGWWEYDEPDDWMTAYVLEGLWRVRQAGVDDSRINKEKTLDWAEKRLESFKSPNVTNPGYEMAGQVDLACAVLLYRPSEKAKAYLLKVLEVKKLDTTSLAKIIVACKRAGVFTDRLPALYSSLLAQAEETRDTMHWPENGWYEPTATALEAVVMMEPGSPRIARVFRYLYGARRGDTWTSTRDTARILMSATEYLKRTKELTADLDVTVSVNGREVIKNHFSKASFEAAPVTVSIPATALKKGANSIQIRTNGVGKAYYSATLDQDVRASDLVAMSDTQEFTLERSFHSVSPQRLEDGSLRLVVGKNPVTRFRSGEVLRCRVIVNTKKHLSNTMIEVPIPSNMRIIDSDEPLDGATWDWWWGRSIFTDDKAVFFGNIESGRPQVIEFAVRAESPGTGVALPANLFRMYQPDERVSTSGVRLEVVPK